MSLLIVVVELEVAKVGGDDDKTVGTLLLGGDDDGIKGIEGTASRGPTPDGGSEMALPVTSSSMFTGEGGGGAAPNNSITPLIPSFRF